ncbi:MAG: hypothetical protein WA705_13680 [Candidatus Ozemobacteraceae bacterium]
MKSTHPLHFKKIFPILLLLICGFSWLFAGAERLWPWEGRYQESDPDALLYLRWLDQSNARGSILTSDTYSVFPASTPVALPPLNLGILVFSCRLFYALFPADICLPTTVIGMISPIIGILLSGIILLFVNRFKSSYSLLVWCALGTIPGVMSRNVFTFMAIDHHYLETFFLWSWVISSIFHVHSPTAWKKIMGGTLVFGFILSWTGAPFFFLAITFYSTILWMLRHSNAPLLLEFSGSTMLIGGGLTAIFLAFFPPPPGIAITFFGWFQCLFLLLLGFYCQLLYGFRDHWSKNQRILAVLLTVSVVVFAIALISPEPFKQAGYFLLKQNPLLSSVAEMQSPIKWYPKLDFAGSLVTIVQQFGVTVFFFPVFLLAFSRHFSFPGAILFRDTTIFIACLGLIQFRFFRWLFPGQIVIFGIILSELFHTLRKSFSEKKRALSFVAYIIVCSLVLLHLKIAHANISMFEGLPGDTIDVLNWLRRRTPSTSGFIDTGSPEYGILAYWDQGNQITCYSQRPVTVSNTFGGMKRMAEVMMSTDEEIAFNACRRNAIRYVFITPIQWDVSLTRWFFELQESSGTTSLLHSPTEAASSTRILPQPEQTFQYWLGEKMGMRPLSPQLSVSSRFACRYISENSKKSPQPRVMVFEVVDGAILVGNADPDSMVTAVCLCKMGYACVPYLRYGKTDKNGIFHLRVAYPTSYDDGRIVTSSNYTVHLFISGKHVIHPITVGDTSVREGKEINVPQ